MQLHAIDSTTLKRLLTYPACIDVVSAAMQATSAGKAELPLRHGLPLPNGMLGMMYGYLGEPECFGIKLVSLFPGNAGTDLSSHMGLMMLYEAERGQPLAIMDGGLITAIRTAAASAVATRELAREDAQTLAIIGAGEQAEAHINAIPCVRDIREIRIWARRGERANALAERATRDGAPRAIVCDTVDDAVRRADIVCTVTSASEPVLHGAQLEIGMHLNLVGASFPDRREVDDDAVAQGQFFVDYRPSTEAQAGEYLHALEQGVITPTHIRGEIGEVISGERDGRTAASQITMYKSLGVASQDLAAALHVYRAAIALDATQVIEI